MTKDQTTYIPPNEPTEAAVLRSHLAEMDDTNDTMRLVTEQDRAAHLRMVTVASALRYALRKLEWLPDETTVLGAG